MEKACAALEHLTQIEYLYACAAALVLAFLLFLLVRRQPKNVVAYSTENGQVMVSRSAIIELVQTSCEQIEEVSKPQVRINAKGKKTDFEVRLKLASGGHLRAIEETLQRHLRRALSENLGIEGLGRINIIATGFKSGKVEPRDSTTAAAAGTPDESHDEPDLITEPAEDLSSATDESKNQT